MMLRMTRKTLLAIEAVLDVAYNARPNPVQSRDITARQGIPQRYLEQVLQHLVRKGVLKGVRGPRGGYTLARERRKVTLGDVVRVISQMDADEDASIGGAELGTQVIGPIWEKHQNELLSKLDKISMEDLCNQARAAGIGRTDEETIDFTI